MHRLTTTYGLCCLVLALAACGEKKAPATPTEADSRKDETAAESDGSETSDAGAPEKPHAPKADACVGFDISNLDDMLAKADCEVPNTKPDAVQNADMKGKLEVSVTASPTKAKPGSKVDLLVTFANKSKESLPLYFRIDPVARFETETYDAKAKRADMPPGHPPPPPKGHTAPPPADQKVGKVLVAANGSVRVRLAWDANKMKWAPEKVRGTAVEKGYPRVPAGPLPKGKYTVKVVTPLIGVFEGGEHEVSSPKVDIEVGG